MKSALFQILIAVGLASMLGCAEAGGSKQTACTYSSDCPDGQRCRMGVCLLTTDNPCPPGQRETADGCTTGSACTDNDDCVGGRCVDGECFTNACSDGDERICPGTCGLSQQCRGGVWRPCPVITMPDGGQCPEDAGMQGGELNDAGSVDGAVINDAGDLTDGTLIQDAAAQRDAEGPERDAGMMPDARLPGPDNDFCMDAERIVTQGLRRTDGNTRNARREYGEGPDVWFTFILERPTTVDALVTGLGNWDTFLYLLRGECGALRRVASNDDYEDVGRSRITEEALSPGTYHLVVSGYSEGASGVFDLSVSFQEFRVTNDTCDNATRLQAVGLQSRVGDTTGAANDYNPERRGPDVWYTVQLQEPMHLRAQVEGEENWDTYLTLARGRCADLDEVAANDDSGGIGRSEINQLGLEPGTYFLIVSGFSNVHFGAFDLEVEFRPVRAFNEAIFMATHNSYSGGDRGSINEQLNQGIRVIELDVHDDDFRDRGDYQIGHDGPGDEVARGGGNPVGNLLTDWLETVHDWSVMNDGHSPITIVLDLKDDITDNRSFDDGNAAALNDRLSSVFGRRLARAGDFPARGDGWPYVEELRGKVLFVLSGRADNREAYRSDEGHNPAISLNTRRQVVEVHDNGRTDLWYWTGRLSALDGDIEWLGHARYDSGRTPAVDINANGVVVEVHKSQNGDTLWSRVGQFRPDGTGIEFGDSQRFDSGVLPSVRFIAPDRVREIHKSPNNDQRWERTGIVDSARRTIQWSDSSRTNDPYYSRNRASISIGGNQRFVSVTSRAADQHLRYSTNEVINQPIRYSPIAFVEAKNGEDDMVDEWTRFVTARASERDAAEFTQQWRNRGAVVRLWSYGPAQVGLTPQIPATDDPFANWYRELARRLDAYGLNE